MGEFSRCYCDVTWAKNEYTEQTGIIRLESVEPIYIDNIFGETIVAEWFFN